MNWLPEIPDEKLNELIQDNSQYDGLNDYDYKGLVTDVINYLTEQINGISE